MASLQRLGITHLSNSDGGFHNTGGSHRSLNVSLEKSHNSRDGHEGRVGAGSTPPGAGPSSQGELLPLSSVLCLSPVALGDSKGNRHVELRRAINAATGSQVEDPTLGNLQAKSLESMGVEDLKRVRISLLDNARRSRERGQHLSEAVIKLDRFQNSLQQRKRCRIESSPTQRPAGNSQVTKALNSSAITYTLDPTSQQKGGDKAKSGIINKRVRTSLADVRPEGRPSNLSVQRSSGIQDRERDPKPSIFLSSPVVEKVPINVGSSDGWEKTKMKGRRSATIKNDVPVPSGPTDGEREHRGIAQNHRLSVEGRSRPSEGHGYRSGPGNGITSMQKDLSVQSNGSTRGGSKADSDTAVHAGDKGDRPAFVEHERSSSKSGIKSSCQEDARVACPAVSTKAKGARAPRSNLVAGSNQFVNLSRSSFTDVQEKPFVTAPPKPHVPSGATNRKRPAPAGSPSPPVASWGSSRPQKMARVARRVNLPPISVSTPPNEERNGVTELSIPCQDGIGTMRSPSPRSTPPALAASNLVKQVTTSSTHILQQNKSRNDRLNASLGVLDSDDPRNHHSHKPKEKVKSQESVGTEKKAINPSKKLGSVVPTAKKARVVATEEIGGGDGVRRQSRMGRGSVALRVPAVMSPPQKVEVSPVNAKPTRGARATVETKAVGSGRPITKKGTNDRKGATRSRCLPGNSPSEVSGEEDDDHKHLVRAVRQAVEFSVAVCPSDFWKQVEAYFAYVTPDDLTFLHDQISVVQGEDTVSLSQMLDEGSNSLDQANGDCKSHGYSSGITCNNLKERKKEQDSRRGGVGRVWFEKIFPLSQRLVSAFINEDQADNCQMMSDEDACVDRDSDLPIQPHSCMDRNREDLMKGETDCDIVKSEFVHWRSGACEGPVSRCSPNIDGHVGYLEVDDQGKEDFVDSGAAVIDEKHCDLSDWEVQYQQMSLDERLMLELQSIGLLPLETNEESDIEDHEIDVELRVLQHQFTEQVYTNKEHIRSLENTVLARREAEARAQEQLAMDRLVEMAGKKRLGGRSKGAAAKGARVAALSFAKRVLTKVKKFDDGHSCIVDPALRESLFHLVPQVTESAPGATGDDCGGGALTAVSDSTISNSNPPLKLREVAASGDGFVEEQRNKSERIVLKEHSLFTIHTEQRVGPWPLWDKEQGFLLPDNAKHSTFLASSPNDNLNGINGVKGKRSDRDREGKAASFVFGKEGNRPPTPKIGKAEEAVSVAAVTPPRSGVGKGDRKTKTKPRQKTGGPLLKPINGLVPKASDSRCVKHTNTNKSSNHHHHHHHHHIHDAASGRNNRGTRELEALGDARPPGVIHAPKFDQVHSEEQIDLSALPSPVGGVGDMASRMAPQQDLAWFDFDVEESLQQTEDIGLGLDVPMDDLSELDMMM